MFNSMRDGASSLVSYEFTGYATVIEAKKAYEKKTSRLWEEHRELENMATLTQDAGDLKAARTKKAEAIDQLRQWEDFAMQAENHFKVEFKLNYWKVLATILSGQSDYPDDMEEVVKLARDYKDGKEYGNRYLGAGRFNSLNHYMQFVDECIKAEASLAEVPAVIALMEKLNK